MTVKTRSPAAARAGQLYRINEKTSVQLLVVERKQFPRVTAVPYMIW